MEGVADSRGSPAWLLLLPPAPGDTGNQYEPQLELLRFPAVGLKASHRLFVKIVIVQLPLYRSNQALDIFKITLDIWKVMKYAWVDECEGAPESLSLIHISE